MVALVDPGEKITGGAKLLTAHLNDDAGLNGPAYLPQLTHEAAPSGGAQAQRAHVFALFVQGIPAFQFWGRDGIVRPGYKQFYPALTEGQVEVFGNRFKLLFSGIISRGFRSDFSVSFG
ncbi:MAG: hypothetical protein D6722_16470 [Bacteroidetes bacterium]|nr:MAG: hypothetical protein D6722_16470 [Bacteroidota bacterium]